MAYQARLNVTVGWVILLFGVVYKCLHGMNAQGQKTKKQKTKTNETTKRKY